MPADLFPPGTPVGVLIPRPPGRMLDYLAPDGGCAAGDLVEVPLGPTRALGCVWGPAQGGLARSRTRRRCATSCAPSCRARPTTR